MKTTSRKSAAWSGGNDGDDEDDQFLTFGDSMYSDSASSRANVQNSVSYTRNRAKITNIQVSDNRLMPSNDHRHYAFKFVFFRTIVMRTDTRPIPHHQQQLPQPQQRHSPLMLLWVSMIT